MAVLRKEAGHCFGLVLGAGLEGDVHNSVVGALTRSLNRLFEALLFSNGSRFASRALQVSRQCLFERFELRYVGILTQRLGHVVGDIEDHTVVSERCREVLCLLGVRSIRTEAVQE